MKSEYKFSESSKSACKCSKSRSLATPDIIEEMAHVGQLTREKHQAHHTVFKNYTAEATGTICNTY